MRWDWVVEKGEEMAEAVDQLIKAMAEDVAVSFINVTSVLMIVLAWADIVVLAKVVMSKVDIMRIVAIIVVAVME